MALGARVENTRKTLYLHIGHFKTGTTALQVLLYENRSVLARYGIDYLEHGCNLAKHSDYAFPILKAAQVDTLMHGYKCRTEPGKLWSGLFQAVRSSPHHTCLVSSEEFIRIGAYPAAIEQLRKLAELAGEDIDIRVIAYLRPPDSHLRSWYNQLVKMKVPVPAFNEAVIRVIEPIHYDYGLALRPWIDIFGKQAVTVRVYDPAMRQGDALFRDFLSIFNITLRKWRFKLPVKDPNPKLDDSVLELLRMMRSAGFSEPMITRAQKRAEKYLQAESESQALKAEQFVEISQRAAEGVDALKQFEISDRDISLLQANLPVPQRPEEDRFLRQIGLLVSEMQHMHARLMRSDRELNARMDALEKRIK